MPDDPTIVQLSNGAWVDVGEFAYAQYIPQRYSTEVGESDNPVAFVLVVFHTGVKTKFRVDGPEEGEGLRDEVGMLAKAARARMHEMVEKVAKIEGQTGA